MKQRFIIERKNERQADVLARAHRALDEAARDGDVMVVLDEVKRTLDQKSLAEIATLHSAAPVQWFAVNDTTIEFRGVPETDAEMKLFYMGAPAALSSDSDTNDLLTNHETIYVSGSRFFLYKHTQDLELAQGELDTFTAAIETLNEQQARKLGGASVRPAYHFGPIYRGY